MDPIENWKVTELGNYEVKELQVPIYKKGKLVYNNPSLSEKQEYCSNQIKTLYPEVTRIVKPHGYYVVLSQELLDLKRNLIVESKKSK